MGAPLEISRTDRTGAELRALSGRCRDGAQVRRILAVAMVLEGRTRTEAAEEVRSLGATFVELAWIGKPCATGFTVTTPPE